MFAKEEEKRREEKRKRMKIIWIDKYTSTKLIDDRWKYQKD